MMERASARFAAAFSRRTPMAKRPTKAPSSARTPRLTKAQREAARINALAQAFQSIIAAHKAEHESTPRKAAESRLDVQQALVIALALEIWPDCEGDECSEALEAVKRALQARVTEIETSYQEESLFPDDGAAAAFAIYESEALH
jgi:hypothetical protein